LCVGHGDVNAHLLAPRRHAANQFNAAALNAQFLGKPGHKRIIRLAIHWRRREADAKRTIVQADQLGSLGARHHADVENNGAINAA